jgi:multiple sugar transport system ATP-binding protein
MTLADRVVVMNDGRIEQVGTPMELNRAPATKFVAGFIGSPAMNIAPCSLVENASGLSVSLGDGLAFPVPPERTNRYRAHVGNSRLLFGLRPEHLTDMRAQTAPSQHPFEVTLDVTEPMGMDTLVFFRVQGVDICGRTNPGANAQAGQPLKMLADLDHMHLIDEATGKVL